MEKKVMNCIINKAGGNASKAAVNFKISIPSTWAKQIGITSEDRSLSMEFDGECIVIRKFMSENKQEI